MNIKTHASRTKSSQVLLQPTRSCPKPTAAKNQGLNKNWSIEHVGIVCLAFAIIVFSRAEVAFYLNVQLDCTRMSLLGRLVERFNELL